MQTGSFTPRQPDVSARGPISVFSDGRLEIKPTWMRDTAEALAWRDVVVERLAKLGWQQPSKEGKALVLRVPLNEWLPKARELLAAILPE